jgi:hypothetical protein
MMIIFQRQLERAGLLKLSFVCIFFLVICLCLKAQEKPPRPVTFYFYQNMSFGAFSLGTVDSHITLTPYGARNVTQGNVILFMSGWPYYPAIYEVEGNPGTVVHFLPGPDSPLYGSPSGTLQLQLDQYIPGDPIILNTSPPARTQVKLGGILIISGIPSNNPPGSYVGSFSVMLIQE